MSSFADADYWLVVGLINRTRPDQAVIDCNEIANRGK